MLCIVITVKSSPFNLHNDFYCLCSMGGFGRPSPLPGEQDVILKECRGVRNVKLLTYIGQ